MKKENKYFGDRAFYSLMLRIAIPIMVQNGITNFVNLLDNIMVGQMGTVQMSSVSIVNQLIFVFNLCIFGGLSGAGIFSAQYVGKGDMEGLRATMRMKLWIGAFVSVAGLLVYGIGGSQLISLYLHGQAGTPEMMQALDYGMEYLLIMLIGFIPFVMSQIYASTLRETGETMLPMIAGIVAVVVNLVFNYILIFGHFGAPAMGISGAAIATVISRFVEMIIVMAWPHTHAEKNGYIVGLYRTLRVPGHLFRDILIKGTPLLINEFFWSSAIATVLQCYSVRGLSVVAAMNINSTLGNIFNIVFISMGTAVSILVGQQLGAGNMENAKLTASRTTVFSVLISTAAGVVMFLFHSVFPMFYNTLPEVRELAGRLIVVYAAAMPLMAYTNCAYFIIRSGGKTWITLLFDSVYVWSVNVSLAFVLSHYTALSIVLIYFIVQFSEIIKCVIGAIMVKKGIWLVNIVEEG